MLLMFLLLIVNPYYFAVFPDLRLGPLDQLLAAFTFLLLSILSLVGIFAFSRSIGYTGTRWGQLLALLLLINPPMGTLLGVVVLTHHRRINTGRERS